MKVEFEGVFERRLTTHIQKHYTDDGGKEEDVTLDSPQKNFFSKTWHVNMQRDKLFFLQRLYMLVWTGHVVEDFSCKILMKFNLLTPKKKKNEQKINSCEVCVDFFFFFKLK